MSTSLPFLPDPNRFLRSRLWSCHEGRYLSAECARQVEQFRATESSGQRPDTLAVGRMTSAFIDCYVHARICGRCVPVQQFVCEKGYELMRQSRAALANAAHPSQSGNREQGPTVSQSNVEACLEEFWRHRDGCEVCAAKCNSLPVWNIEAALSQQMEL